MSQIKIPAGFLIDETSKHKHGTLVYEGDDIYFCTLNQTDIKNNNNKYYIMQLIEDDSKYYHLIRYGRIGEIRDSSETEYLSKAHAISAFEKQFKLKTKNNWSMKNKFVKHDGKYFLTEFSYEDELKKVMNEVETKKIKTTSIKKESSLELRVQFLLELMSNKKMMQESLVQMEIDTKKMPLGKIKQSQLEMAKKILSTIRPLVEEYVKKTKDNTNNDSIGLKLYEDIVDMSSQYYTLVPYSCGRRKPPIICDDDKLAKLDEIIDELMNIAITTKIIEQSEKSEINELDIVYKEINTVIKPLEMGEREWNLINAFVTNTHAPTHRFNLKVMDLYKIERSGEKTIYESKYGHLGNKQILVHGSRMANWVSILKNGLMLDPSKLGVVVTGKMFGYGIYFANSISKSAQYCGATEKKQKICLALAEVALGNESKRKTSDYTISKKSLEKEKCDSCWGMGQKTPSSFEDIDGASIATGTLVNSKISGASLLYDEKIVYDANQFYLKYLMVLEMNS
jgi:predicted DNA-binding WGR domain protein